MYACGALAKGKWIDEVAKSMEHRHTTLTHYTYGDTVKPSRGGLEEARGQRWPSERSASTLASPLPLLAVT